VTPNVIRLGPARPWVVAALLFVILVIVILPLFALVLTSFLRFWGAPLTWEHIGFSGDFLWDRAARTIGRKALNLSTKQRAA
jgi:ABC-type Fe3+ transport system permease subunit